jgi:hypothetical protein
MNLGKAQTLAAVAANQYWQLINAMLFNLKTIGYVFVVFFSVALIAGLLVIIFPGFYRLGVGLTFLAGLILAFVGIMALPMGMVSLLANRHIFIMADIRKKLFVIVCAFCFFVSFLVCSSPFFIKNEVLSFGIVAYISLSCALYFWLATYVCSKRFELSFISPLVMIAWVKVSFDILVELHPAALCLMVLLSWMLFYRWWIAFSPKHPRIKSILVETDRRKMQETLSIEKWQYFLSNNIKTPIGSLLLGFGDSSSAFVKSLVFVYLVALIFSFFVCSGFVDWQFTDSAFTATIIAFGYSFLMSAITLPAKTMLMNVRRGWLAFVGNRVDFFLYLECQFFKGLGVLVILNLVLIILLLLISNHAHYFIYCVAALLGLSVLAILMFYTDMYFYKRGRLVPGDINLFKTAVNLIGFVPLVCYLIYKYQTFNVFEVKDAIAVGLALLVVLSLKAIRTQAINKWQKTDL